MPLERILAPKDVSAIVAKEYISYSHAARVLVKTRDDITVIYMQYALRCNT
jgi:hypothetical protein